MSSDIRTALVIGATGLVGSHVVRHLLDSDKYGQITLLLRKNQYIVSHPKLKLVVFDFDKPDSQKIVADDIYCCLGTTMKKAGSKEAFYKVDYTYPVEIAKMALANGAKRFAIITAMGANPTSMFYYNRVKGEVEKALKAIPYKAVLVFRPSLLLGNRAESRLGEQIGEKLAAAFKFLIPDKYQAIEADKVATAMVAITSSQVEGFLVYESDVIQEF